MTEQEQSQQTYAPPRPGQMRELYKFNPDELRVLKECRNESFYYRCLPLGTTLGMLGYYAVKSGYLKPSVKYGPWPKVAMGVVVGYIAGKMSYQTKCAEKMMSLPNSPLGEALRKSKGKAGLSTFQEGFTSEPINLAPQSAEPESGTFQDSIQELRAEDRSYDAPPTISGLDDTFRPTLDSFVVEEQPLPPAAQNVASYDDLRRKNREEYEQRRAEAIKRVDPPRRPPVSQPSQPAYGSRSSPSSSEKTNAYGDVWEE